MSKPYTTPVLVTGSQGFIGKNLCLRLRELGIDVLEFHRGSGKQSLESLVHESGAIVHLAGVNRPPSEEAFSADNRELTEHLCQLVSESGGKKILFASSTQADLKNPYGESKRHAESALSNIAKHGHPVAILRLPGVFGKWCKPDYNSVVATFCHNIARDLPVRLDNPDAALRLSYIDDVVDQMIELLSHDAVFADGSPSWPTPRVYETTVGELKEKLERFQSGRVMLRTEHVGIGLDRALYATFVSYLPPEKFAYSVPSHDDERGSFVEMLKTPSAGQFSYFSAKPGVTRGGHYHHTKTEKFLVISGEARFRYRHMQTGEVAEFFASGSKPEIVESIPGWAHDISNIGDDEMLVLLWANEVFDQEKPDTIANAP